MAKVAAKAKDRPVKKKQTVGMKILTILFSIVSVFYVAPVFIVLMNLLSSCEVKLNKGNDKTITKKITPSA